MLEFSYVNLSLTYLMSSMRAKVFRNRDGLIMTTPTDRHDGKRHELVSLFVRRRTVFLVRVLSFGKLDLLAGEITSFPRLDRTTRLGRLELAGLIYAAGSVFCFFHDDSGITPWPKPTMSTTTVLASVQPSV
jgi:hypothetical protein